MSSVTTPSPSFWQRLTGLSTYPEGPARPSLLAASRRISEARVKRSYVNAEAWQQEAIELYSEVGELRYLANAQANVVSRAHMYVGRYEESDIPTETDDPLANLVWDAFGGGPVQRAEIIKRMSLQLFVPGDGFILGAPAAVWEGKELPHPDLTTVTDLAWNVLASTEVTIKDREIVVDLGDYPVTIPRDRAILIRAWRPNPFRWWQADSPVRSNLPVLRELVGLTKHVSASIDSRLAGAGMLLIGDSFSLLAGQSPDPDDDGETDPVLAALMDAMLTAIKDRDSASAVMPILLQGPDDAIDKVQHLTFSTPFDGQTKELRDEAIRRLALGLDAPPEVLLGMSGSSHWNAWLIQDDYIRSHIEPQLTLICDALTVNYLWPMLEEQGVPDFENYAVWWDTANLTQRADRSKEALELFDRQQLSADALRRETGFDEADAPEQTLDPAVALALRFAEAQPALLADPGLAAVIASLQAALTGAPTAPTAAPVDTPEEVDVTVNDMPDTSDTPDSSADVPDA